MTTRTARCACGRVEVVVEGEPLLVLLCHCDFCQKRSGNVFIASAHFGEEKVIAISGETKVYNGLEADGVGAVAVPGGIDYHFCSTCGSTLYWLSPHSGLRNIAIAVGNFVDADFPMPTTELFTKYRHGWVSPVPGAAQVEDPLDGSQPVEEMVPSLRKGGAATRGSHGDPGEDVRRQTGDETRATLVNRDVNSRLGGAATGA